MEQFQHISQVLALTMGVAWASGINLYAALCVLGLMGATGHMTLPPGLEILTDPLVIGASGLMYMVEFFADKIPGVDSGWDVLHTFVRIPAGALLAAEAVGNVDPAIALAAAILGGGVAAVSHVTKAGTRILINASPEPFSNIVASVSEDTIVVAGLWTAVAHPIAFLVLFVLFGVAVAFALPRIWRGVRGLWRRIRALFGGGPSGPELDENQRPTV